MDVSAFFSGWSGPLRSLVIGACTYGVLMVWLRVSGKRTLSKWNAFDFVVTIALGSTLASALLSKDTALADAAAALATLIGLQFVLTWLSVRSRAFEKLVKSEPVVLLADGVLCESALRRERVAASEVRAAVRDKGIASLEDVAYVVLETNGTFSVIGEAKGSLSALEGLRADRAAGQRPLR